MRAPITDKHLLELMWERFPEIMKRGAEQPAQQEPDAIVTSLTAGPDGVARSGLDRELPLMAGVYLAPQPAQQEPINESTDLLQWREAMDDKETPPAQRNQLTKQERDLIHAATGSMTFFKAVDYAISQTEAAHNIKDQP